jgi:hypothetical protein
VRYRVTSFPSPDYNCIAWAAGDDTVWWEPDPLNQYYWPPAAPRQRTLDAYIAAFETLGYVTCDSRVVEANIDKIAIYVDAAGVPKHAARQLRTGAWTSKLGTLDDIQHATLDALAGVSYGRVAVVMRRQKPRS